MREPLRILVVDDEAAIRDLIAAFLARLGHQVLLAGDGAEGLALAEREGPDLALIDIRMPGLDGIGLLHHLSHRCPDCLVIMISAHGTMDLAIKALRLGACDFLRKPIQLSELETALTRADALRVPHRQALDAGTRAYTRSGTVPRLIGVSRASQETRRLIRMAAASTCDNILLIGETGTGKEVCASLFHHLRCGPQKPFVAVNCPALPTELIESELFGHRKGAFTGAESNRRGAFEEADGGVLFLDEIADLAPGAQAKLLRTLETRRLRRIGDECEQQVTVTVVAASNQPLEHRVAHGAFRADLYYRLNTFSILLLPLRERPEDIGPLTSHFLTGIAERQGRAPQTLAADAHARLLAHGWPGNARELHNVLQRACVLAGAGPICAEHIQLGPPTTQAPPCTAQAHPILIDTADIIAHTRQALDNHDWNRRRAAEALGISYEALRWRIKKYRLHNLNELG